MTYQLFLETEERDNVGAKGVGAVLCRNLPEQYTCYALFFPGSMPDREALRTLGRAAGPNLFVNIGRFRDPDLGRVSQTFELDGLPAIVVTARADLAAPKDAFLNAFVRLDSASLLASPERTVKCVEEIYTLFARGEIAGAIARAKWTERKAMVLGLTDYLRGALGKLLGFVQERDIVVSVAEGRLELRKPAEANDKA